jgi:glycerol uptake facilitator-like aquaporin
MNPVVTLAAAATEGLRWHAVPAYIAAQLAGAILGVWLAHIMFDLPVWQLSQHVRAGVPQWVAEVIATFGLLSVIWGCRAHREPVTAFAVAAYITGAYWFTASTSFANPAVTVARALTDTSPAFGRPTAGFHFSAASGPHLGAAPPAAPFPGRCAGVTSTLEGRDTFRGCAPSACASRGYLDAKCTTQSMLPNSAAAEAGKIMTKMLI